MELQQLKELKHLRGVETRDRFPGNRYAIMCGAMTWVSEANLVSASRTKAGSACSQAGTCAGDPGEGDREDAGEDAETLRREPHHGRPGVQAAGGVVIRERCPFVFFAGSIPSGRDIGE